jgi:hypothetical protein
MGSKSSSTFCAKRSGNLSSRSRSGEKVLSVRSPLQPIGCERGAAPAPKEEIPAMATRRREAAKLQVPWRGPSGGGGGGASVQVEGSRFKYKI